MPVAQQVALFADATHIVAPHGAALANVVFCRAGTVLCELHVDVYVHWMFRRLAALPDLTYGCLVGQTVESGHWVHGNTWSAPLEQLERVLSAAPFATGNSATPVAVTLGRAATREPSAGTPQAAAVTSTHSVRSMVVERVWRGNDPFRGFPGDLYAADAQGWNSAHPYLVSTIDAVRPSVIVEIGVWKGGSVLTMAAHLKKLGLDAVVIAIDTWLGSSDHWYSDELFGMLGIMNGRPSLFQKFMGNVVRAGLQDYVVPLPLDSVNAGNLLRLFDIRPDIVHVDGCNDYHAVTTDFSLWWPQIKEGGALIGDDYYDGGAWSEVRRAIDDFVSSHPLRKFEHLGGKCRLLKPS